MLAIAAALILATSPVQPATVVHFEGEPLPACEMEDGSTGPENCVWDDGSGDVVINIDYGESWIVVE